MKKGWEIKKLGEVCDTGAGGTPLKTHKDYYEGGNIPWILSGEVSQGEIFEAKNFITERGLKNSSAKLFPPNTVLVAMYGATAGQVGILRFESATNQAVCGILPNDKTIPEYLFYCFLSKKDELVAQAVGGAQPNISQIKIKNTKIPLPPLPEQQRIVSILDECFAAIDQAKANAEQNLKNARELFESYLQGVFENKGEGWEEQYFVNCFKLKSGDNLTAKDMSKDGIYPVFGGNGIAGYHNEYNLSGSNIIIGRVGALCGNVRHISDKIWLTDNAFKIIDFKFDFDHSFLTYLLNHKDLRSFARQAAQPVISNSSLKEVILYFPQSLSIQKAIVQHLDAVRAETQKLEEVYQQKISSLEELKKSILKKAFAGELSTQDITIT